MSYCVNCGVELDTNIKKCSLCDTPVFNPNNKKDSTDLRAYPEKLMIPAGIRRRYAAFIVSMIVLIPNIVCIVLNLIYSESGRWALYVFSSSALFWLLFVLPFLVINYHPYLLLSIDSIAISLYIYVFFALNRTENGGKWFLEIALPLIFYVLISCIFMIKWLSKKKDPVHIAIAVLAIVAVFSITGDLLMSRYYNNDIILAVSIVVAASCVSLIAFFIATARNKRLRAWLSRRFFI